MPKYFVSELYPQAKFTAGVLRDDIESTLHSSGYVSVNLAITKKGTINKIADYYKTFRRAKQLKKENIVFFHFPLRSRLIRFFHSAAKKRNCKTVAYIHDFEGLRDRNNTQLQNEINQLTKFSCIIAQNKVMKELILQNIPNSNVVILEMYDYLNLAKRQEPTTKLSNEICFAGNLSKASFISNLTSLSGLQFYIYGEAPETVLGENINLMGKTDPRILPTVLKGSFGLIWDGNSIETGEGYGEYLKYNTPHKLSLYLAAGLPLIVWKESAMADWVIENKVGITISSLREINERIKNLTQGQYQSFQENILPIQSKIMTGHYLQQALKAIENSTC